MNDELLNLRREVYRLTTDFGAAATAAFVALNSDAPVGALLPLVDRCVATGALYDAALASLLSALRAAPAEASPGEAERVSDLKATLARELDLILTHPRLAT